VQQLDPSEDENMIPTSMIYADDDNVEEKRHQDTMTIT